MSGVELFGACVLGWVALLLLCAGVVDWAERRAERRDRARVGWWLDFRSGERERAEMWSRWR